MIRVVVANNVKRENAIVDENRTLRSVLEEKEIDYSRGTTTLDGAPLGCGDLDKTFKSLGISDHCFLCSIVKAD